MPARAGPPVTFDDLKPFVFGGMASCTAEAATFPIDVAKTRLQLQTKRAALQRAARDAAASAASTAEYRGMVDVWRRVAAEEGPAVLYRGLSPALLRQASYGTIKFGLYHTAKEAVPLPDSSAKNVICAVCSGAAASAVANPTDVLKVRLQARQASSILKDPAGAAPQLVEGAGMWSAFADIARREGVRGLWRGVVPTAQRAAVVAGVQLPVYDACKAFLLRHALLGDGAPNHLVSSLFAGLCTCLASQPVDVVRTRLMSQRNLRKAAAAAGGGGDKRYFLTAPDLTSSPKPTEIYRTSLHCALATVRNEGFLALYKGFVPSFMRMGPWNIIFFLVYERLKKEFPFPQQPK